jgi:hypothetical protein
MLAEIHAHPVVAALIAFWLFSAAVSPMPAPKPEGWGFYSWLYGFLHGILQFASGAIMRVPMIREWLMPGNVLNPSSLLGLSETKSTTNDNADTAPSAQKKDTQ